VSGSVIAAETMKIFFRLLLLLVGTTVGAAQSNNNATCSVQLLETCASCLEDQDQQQATKYECSAPGLESFSPGQYEGVTGKLVVLQA